MGICEAMPFASTATEPRGHCALDDYLGSWKRERSRDVVEYIIYIYVCYIIYKGIARNSVQKIMLYLKIKKL